MGGLVPTARGFGADAPRALARAFARFMWPAYAVLLITGVWNISAVHSGQPHAWQVVLTVKVVVVILAGLAVWLHGRATSRQALAAWGAAGALFSVAAMVMGVFLAG